MKLRTLRSISSRSRLVAAAIAALPAGFLIAVAVGAREESTGQPAAGGPESPVQYENDDAPAPRRAATVYGRRRFAEPLPVEMSPGAADPALERLMRRPVPSQAPDSVAVARAIDRLKSQSPPANEVFALVTVADRSTGRRQAFTRGQIDYDAARAIADPGLAPAGTSYEEGESVTADDEVEIVTRWIASHPVPLPQPGAITREEEEELDLRQRNREGGLSHRIDGGLRSRVLTREIDLAGHGMVPVVIEMRSVPPLRIPKAHDLAPAGLLYVGLDALATRERALIERKKEMPLLQAGLERAIEAGGGKVRHASWMTGTVRAYVPARAIPAIASRADVFRIEYDEPLTETSDAFQGNDYYVAMDVQDYDPYHAGNYGPYSKHTYSPNIVMGLSEPCLDLTNPAWDDGNTTAKRAFLYDCDDTVFCTQAGVEECSGSNGHGTKVAQLMAGDFMDGQDPLLSTANRRILTGVCDECRFVYLQDRYLSVRSKAHDMACELGVDVFESSIGTVAQSCDGVGPFDTDIVGLVNCGVHYVQSAGNEGSGGGCTTTHPGDDPWTLTVGGLQSNGACSTSGAYYTNSCPFDPGSSKGGGPYDVTGTASIIDLTAPYRMANLLVPLTRNPVSWGHGNGTSFGTPIVAGLTARFMDMYSAHYSPSVFYANRARVMMLLWGDRSDLITGSLRLSNDFSDWWGAGRVGLVPFDFNYDVGLYRSSKVLLPGETWSFTDTGPGPASIFYKAVVWHDGKDYAGEPMIQLTLTPTGCNGLFKPNTVERLDSKAMLTYSGHAGLNNCSAVNVSIKNIQVGFSTSRTFHYAAYFDTQDERNF